MSSFFAQTPARSTVMLTAQAEAAMRWHETSSASMVVIQSVAHAALPGIDLLALPGRTGLHGTRALVAPASVPLAACAHRRSGPSLCCRYCDRIYVSTRLHIPADRSIGSTPAVAYHPRTVGIRQPGIARPRRILAPGDVRVTPELTAPR